LAICADRETGVTKGAALRRRIPIFLSLLALVWTPAAAAAKAKADLTVSASAAGVVAIDDEFTATATVQNRGPASGNAVTLTATLTGPLALLSVDTSKGSCSISGLAVTCSLGKLSKGATVNVDFELSALGAGDLRGSFTVRAHRPDPAMGNNTAGTLTSVPPAECTVLGTAGNDRLQGTGGEDVICGLGGNDVLSGSGGNDTLYGGSGNDSLAGGPGDDQLRGEAGSDTATYKSAGAGVRADLASRVATGHGTDSLSSVERLVGSRYRDHLRGSRQANVLSGAGGADRILGGGGRDTLRGNSGNDYLNGGRGADRLYGSRGRDRCLSGLRFSC
jgi:Ca2+-binding RTX toxin-like protein